MEIVIRKIREADYFAVYNFQCQYLDQENYESFVNRVNSDPDLYITAFLNEDLAGICYGRPQQKDPSAICLQGIAVNLDAKKEVARHGIGSALLKEFEEIALKMGYHKVSLGSADDEKVENFYLKNGYRPIELVAFGQEHEEYDRVRTNDYESGKALKRELYGRYHPMEVIFIFQKII